MSHPYILSYTQVFTNAHMEEWQQFKEEEEEGVEEEQAAAAEDEQRERMER